MVIEIQKILDEDRLLRRVLFMHPHFIKDDGTPTSLSFQLKKNPDGSIEDGLSVDLEKLTTYISSIEDITRFRLYSLLAKSVRDLGLQCIHNPQPNNIAHSLVIGSITKPLSRKLASMAVRINYPD